MTLNEIIEDLEHTIEYFKHPKTQVQVGRIYQAEKTLKQLRLYSVAGRSEQLKCTHQWRDSGGYFRCCKCGEYGNATT